MSFRLKTVLGIAAIEIVLLAILIVSGLHYLRSSNEEQLFERARTTARLFATMTSDAVLATDLAALDTLVEHTLKNPGIAYARVRQEDGTVLSEGGEPEALQQPFVEDAMVKGDGFDVLLDVSHPITVAGQSFGRVEIGLATGGVASVLGKAGNWMLAIAAMEIALVGIFGFLLGTILTRRLAHLRAGAKKVAAGQFGYQLTVRGDDELADTTRSFNRMSYALSQFAEKALSAQRLAEEQRDYAEGVLKDGMNSMPQGMLMVDADAKVTFANDAFKVSHPAAIPAILRGACFSEVAAVMEENLAEDEADTGDDPVGERIRRLQVAEQFGSWRSTRRDGKVVMNTQRRMSHGGVVVVETDVTELYEALERNRQLQMELMESQKRESLGTLAGGIAHEINTPVQYIGNNIKFLMDAFEGMSKGLEACIDDLKTVDPDNAQTHLNDMDWEFLVEEIPAALSEATEGVRNVSRIVLSMKEVSYPESDEAVAYDLRRLIENAMTVSRNQWKYCADVQCDIGDGDFEIPCYPGELSQVLINLLVNAAHAVEEKAEAGERGQLGVSLHRTTVPGDTTPVVKIEVSDNGSGIAPENLNRIFDMFFTTKGPGKGTGQGLAICRSIVMKKHGGRLTVESEPGVGTTFTILLPVEAKTRLAS